MDGIQPYAGPPGRPAGLSHHGHSSQSAKSPADFVRALRRRAWLVLILALVVGVSGAIWTVRRPAVYRVTAQILIEPPQFDAVLTSIVSHDVGRHDPEPIAK